MSTDVARIILEQALAIECAVNNGTLDRPAVNDALAALRLLAKEVGGEAGDPPPADEPTEAVAEAPATYEAPVYEPAKPAD